MPFTNDGPYASFYDNGFVPVQFVTSSSPTEWNDNIRCDKKSIFIMEIYQVSPNASIPYYKQQAIEVSTTGNATISAIGGNGTFNAHTNSTTSDQAVLGFTTSNYSYPTFMRITPIVGNVEILG